MLSNMGRRVKEKALHTVRAGDALTIADAAAIPLPAGNAAWIVNRRIYVTGISGVGVALHHADGKPVLCAKGFKVGRLFLEFHPTYLLDVVMADGTPATYFIDQTGLKLGESPESLPDSVLADLQKSVLSSNKPVVSYHKPGGAPGIIDEDFMRDVVFITVTSTADGLYLSRGQARSGNRPLLLKNTLGQPLGAFDPGWHARFLYTGFTPLHVLELAHQDGRQASWYLSSDGEFFSHQIEIVPELFRRPIIRFGARRIMEEADTGTLLLRGFGFINRQTRADLEPFFPIAVDPGSAQASVFGRVSRSETQLISPPAAGQLTLVEHIDTTVAAFSRERLMEGWAYREGRCWTAAEQSIVTFALPFHPQIARLRVDFQAGAGRRLVTVVANGWTIGESVIDPERGECCRRDFWIPREAMADDQVVVAFRFDVSNDPYACMMRAIRLDIGEAVTATGATARIDSIDARSLMSGFENIGDNCEFGLVQRYFGAEPMGLLRFADYGEVFNLIRMLESGFAGLGAKGALSAQLVTTLSREAGGALASASEFYIADIEQNYGFHSWRGPDEHSEQDAIEEAEQKLAYLRRKMLERLRANNRIWLFKRTRQTDPHEVFALHAALRQYGPNRIFWVRAAKPGRPPGSVEWLSDGLLCGYSDQDHVYPHLFDPVRWLSLCTAAQRAFATPHDPAASRLP